MKKIYITLCLGLLGLVPAITQAQNLEVDKDFKKNRRAGAAVKPASAPSIITSQNPEQCGYNIVMANARKKGFRDAEFEARLNQLVEARKATGARFTGPVTIPVIFHVIYRTANTLGNNSPNLSTAKFQSQVDQLNLDYGNLSGSTYGVAADVQIRFCMAVVDPQGKTLAEPGIERINGQTRVPAFSNTSTMSQGTLISYFDNTIKPATIWDPYSYFNVWTAPMTSSGLLGYATFPGFSNLPGLDNGETDLDAGVVINWQSVGSVTNPGASVPYGFGRTLTHEAGHFFGLRHITGDSNCGDDYCADTPPQDDLTAGCPTPGTLNNCTPSQPKMFENYMDYSNDACLNTFTGNQALRSQTVMDNSPRRLQLIGSKACVARAGNAVSFGTKILNITETGVAGSCPNVRTYSINIYVPVQATGAATLNFIQSGTATSGKDYTISPSSVSYTTNDNSVKTITLTVIDDQAVEAMENINISYSITGTGVVAGPDKQSITVNIVDDDFNPGINNGQVTLLNENFESGNIPATWVNQVYGDGATTPNSWVVSNNAGLNGTYAAHITDNVATKTLTYNNLNSSDAYLITPLINATGLKNINLGFKYKCNGEVDYDEGYLGFIPEGMAPTAENTQFFSLVLNSTTAGTPLSLNLPASFNNTKFYFVFNWFNDDSEGTNPPFAIDSIIFRASGTSVASATGSDTSFSQYSGQTVAYYSNTGTTSNILATIANPNQDLGCVTASVSQAGIGRVAFSTTSGTYLRSSKTIQVTPAVANSTATYQATLYFTTAELATWPSPSTLKLMKVSDASPMTPGSPVINPEIVSAVFNDQRTAAGYASFTANFTGGFSKFTLVEALATVPVTTLAFEARPNGKNIQLSWSTSAEYNNKGFVIERSTNGTDFKTIGWKDGAGNSSQLRNYGYSDNFVQPNQLYYYRLRQTDIDSRESLSDIKQAKISDRSSLLVTLSPNPASHQVNIFASGTAGLSNINLLDAKGQLVQSWKQVNCATAPLSLDISNVASGVYMVQVITGDVISTQKLIIN